MTKKLIVLITFTLLSLYVQAQKKYIILDSVYNPNLNYTHIVSEYHGEPIETFNVFFGKYKTPIVLLSVLKPFTEKSIIWIPIDLASIKNAIVSLDSLGKIYISSMRKISMEGSDGLKQTNDYFLKKFDYCPVITKGNQYYVPKLTGRFMLEIFSIVKNDQSPDLYHLYLTRGRQPYYAMDLEGQVLSIETFEAAFLKKFGEYSSNSPSNGLFANTFSNYLIRSTDTVFNGKKAYRFWTLGSWLADGPNLERGIERLTYVPEYGIIAGAYTAHFLDIYRNRRSYSRMKTIDIYGKEIPPKQENYFNAVKPHISYDYLHDIQSTPLRIEVNGKVVYEKEE